MLIETHCHLNFEAFKDDWLEVIEKAKKGGIEKMVVVGTDLETSQRAVEMAEETEGLYATVGFHPHHCRGLKNEEEEIERIIKELRGLAKSKKVVGIGETGLDYYQYKKTKYGKVEVSPRLKNLQKEVFGGQIQLAKELNLALVVHNREAEEDILDSLDHFCKDDGEYPRGVFHCISGSEDYLRRVIELGFYIGVDGNVSYDDEVKKLAKAVPLERLVLETDSPYLMPEPERSRLKKEKVRLRNTPYNVRMVAEFLAKLKGVSLEEIARVTSENAKKLFKF